MVVWTAGAVFGIAWLIFFLPIGILGTIWFWRRRALQPIKARSPSLVVITDIVLLLYVLLLCLQRITGDDYPCLLNLWSGYLGTIVLFNTYLWRCWTLYFRFHLTQEKLDQSKPSEQWFIHRQHWITGRYLGPISILVTVILCLPCLAMTLINEELVHQSGDSCDKAWADAVLAVYVALYVAVFIFFAVSLRLVVDGFKIKEELRLTGIVGAVAVVPWVLFNLAFEDVNNDTFPFSTLFLIIAVVAAFAASTMWPLYRSIFQPPQLPTFEVPDTLNTLDGLLKGDLGIDAFKKFLTKEFSVENILFFLEVEDFRRYIRELEGDEHRDKSVLSKQKEIYTKYIVANCPFQVNLPDHIVKQLDSDIRAQHHGALAKSAVSNGGTISPTSASLSADQVTIDIHGGQITPPNGTPLTTPMMAPGQVPLSDALQSSSSSSMIASTTGGGSGSGGVEAKKEDSKRHSIADASKSALDAAYVAQLTPTIFDSAQKNIFKLMQSDSFPRFIRSDHYKDLVKTVNQSKHAKEVLTEMGIM